MTVKEFGRVGFGDPQFVQRLRAGRVLSDDQEIRVRLVIEDWPLWASAAAERRKHPGGTAAAIRAMVDEGRSARSIAACLGVSLKYVQQVRNRHLWG